MSDDDICLLWSLLYPDPLVGALLPAPVEGVMPQPSGWGFFQPLPPIAGAAPGTPWEWVWDRISGILGGAWDLAEKVGRMLADVVQGVWEWVGGTVRFVYDWLTRFSGWLGSGLSDIWRDVRSYPWSAATWVRDRVWDAANWIKDRVWDGALWVAHGAWDVGIWVKDRLWEVGIWVKDRLWDAATWVKDRVWEAAHWVSDEAWKMATWTANRINDAAVWTVGQVLPPIMGAMGDIGDVFRDAFDLVGGAVLDAGEALGDKIADAFRWPWEHILEPYIDVVQNKLAIPLKLLRGQYSNLEQLLDDALDPAPIVLAGIVGALILVQVLSLAVGSAFETFVTPMALPYQQATAARVGASLLSVGQIQDALNRGLIDEATAADHLSRAGFSGLAKQALLDLRFYVPPPTDLIRMSVREVFDPNARARLTLDADFPDAFARYAALHGISEEWARNYWAMHWDLPSPSQGYEMLHRGLISEQELANLLKALDYAPVWRDKLQAISYSPITRVDLRRLYKAGVISEEDVFRGYKALGYDPEKARWLTDYTKQFYSPEDESQLDDMSDLAASTFRAAYRRHVISRDEALDRIVEAGYTEDVADFLLSIDDAQLALNPVTEAGVPVRDLTVPVIIKAYREKLWDRARAQQELEVLGYLPWEADLLLQLEDLDEERELAELEESVVKEEYIKRAIDRPTASNRLDTLGVSPDRRDLLLRRWDLQAAQKTRTLTVAQIQDALRDGRLTEADALSRFAGLGFNEVDAKLLVDAIDTTIEGTTRRLSASQLSRAYKVGAITDVQFLQRLVALGYSQEDAQVLVDIATPAPEAKQRQLTAAQLASGFRAGLLSDSELLERLTTAGYSQEDAELLRDLAARQPDPPARKLSVANIKDLYKARTLDKAGVLAELLALGYTDRDAGWLRDLITAAAPAG